MGSLTILLMNKLNIQLEMSANKINTATLQPINKNLLHFFFYHNQMYYNYKSDENILRMLMKRNILPTDPNKKVKLIIYYNKFKTFNLVINNNPPLIIYQFKCTLGDCISENNSIYVGLISTTLLQQLTMHLSDTSSIAQHLKKHSCPKTEFQKVLPQNTTILEQ